MKVSPDSNEHQRPDTSGFVGGFSQTHLQGAHSTQNGAFGAPPPSFPQPQLNLNPLPTPPKIRPVLAPEPEDGSRTMRYAQQAASGGLRPPDAQVPHRPHSDSAVPQAEESISSRPSPRPTNSSRRASASHVPAVAGNASPARGRRRASSTASSPPSSSADDRVQCSGTTKAGKRCSRYPKVGSMLTSIDSGVDGEPVRYCHQHRNEILTPSGFYTRTQGQQVWVKFEGQSFPSCIEQHFSSATQIGYPTICPTIPKLLSGK